MIRFPNDFKAENVTVKAQFENFYDLSPLYDDCNNLEKEILKQVEEVKDFYITFSEVQSSINEESSIDYSETIIKIPIKIKEKGYLFPVLTFVTNKYSLLRGFYWGFNKEDKFSIKKTKNSISIFKDGVIDMELPITISINYQTIEDKPEVLNSKIVLYGTSDIMRLPNVLTTLDVKNYILSELKVVEMIKTSVGTLLNHKFTVDEIYFTKDSFQLSDVRKIDGTI